MPASLRDLLLIEFSEQQDPPTRPLTSDDLYEIPGLMARRLIAPVVVHDVVVAAIVIVLVKVL